jgi:xylulokinase
MEASDASGTGILDPVHRKWDIERINSVDSDILKWIPDQILDPNASAGFLKDDVATELGLPSNDQVIVAPGGGDNAMSALGVGAVEQGVWVLSLGTSGTLFGPTKAPILDSTGTICAFCDATGQGLPLLCTINCTGVTEEVKNMCCGGLDHAELAELAAKESPGCHGVTFLPYLGGERTPNWPSATGTLLGLQPGLMRPGVLARAAMEGATFSLLQGLEEMKKQAAGSSNGGDGDGGGDGDVLRATELRIVGGGSKNHTWRQIIADSFQLPLRFPVEPETGALGAALQAAAVATGTTISEFLKSPLGQPELESEVLQPNVDNKQAYSEAFERFTRFGVALFGPNGVVAAA